MPERTMTANIEGAPASDGTLTTAIIGVGKIGSALARHFVAGGEPVVFAAKDETRAKTLSDALRPLARGGSQEDAVVGADVVVLAPLRHPIQGTGTRGSPPLR